MRTTTSSQGGDSRGIARSATPASRALIADPGENPRMFPAARVVVSLCVFLAFGLALGTGVRLTAGPDAALRFALVPTAAAETTNPHGGLPIDCAVCHTATSWSVATRIEGFDHGKVTEYPLTLAHTSVPCRSCHTDLVFGNVGTNCSDCHDDIHNGDLGDRCSRCHTPDTWSAMDAAISEHEATDFPLLGSHASTPCASCHPSALAGGFRDASTECSGCHLDNFLQTTDPNHTRAGFPEDCTSCHSSVAVAWEPAEFEHPSTFPLEDGHAAPTCADCHQTSFDATPTECAECHQSDFETAEPSHEGFPQDCTTCHSTTAWDPADFDHDRSFPLLGAHQEVACADCHSAGYAGTPTECVDCHLTDLDGADPNHDGFPQDCTSCHTLNAWDPADFDHDEIFPLEGAHRDVACADCHTNGYESTPNLCVDCHRLDFENAEPDHVSGAFPEDCITCHSLIAWEPAEFEHPETFPLEQGHADLPCASCHASGYENTPIECVDCHLQDSGEATPSHDGFGPDCITCHSLATWQPATFEHPESFKLDQGHENVECASCHSAGYENTPTECAECHLQDYQQAEPDHVNGGFPTDCVTCHSLAAWQPAAFEHTPTFPLAQGHADLLCASCHSGGTFEDTSTDCVDCHLADSQNATPSHDGFSQDCTSCHSTATWQPANFEHPSTFPLTMGHEGVDCASCHSAGYENTLTDCAECHLADSQQALPSHDGFSQDCTSCHSTATWQPASFEHPSTFPLTQGHEGVDCASCHSSGYEGTPTECADCHLPDYELAEPDHVGGGFPQDCTTCHSLAAWQPAAFEHIEAFPLTQGHADLLCASCHSSGTYEGTSPECVDCHLADSQEATPSHEGFSQECTTCHSTATWQPANFEHPGTFPLTLGHEGVDCASCHSAGYEGTSTDCAHCHLADSEQATPNHDGFSEDCTTCHSTAGWQPANFEHPSTFPLTEGHEGVDCASCHSAGYEGTSTECVDCHIADSQAATPSHDGLPVDCTSCHTISGWIPSSFDHTPSFPLTDGHEGVDCASCHSSGYDDTPSYCIGCHLADAQGAEPSHEGFPDDCTTCHTVQGWTPAGFDHSQNFPLTSGHANVDCVSCHSAGYEDTSTDCVDCHLADSQQAEPSHAEFPTDCTSCHTINGWIPADFEHTSEFPLTQGHADLPCVSCHSAGYENTSSDCIDCHLADFQGADPSHDGFPEDCLTCHSLSAWTPAGFDHSQNFPLTGGHADVDCASCHSLGYENTSTECVECHLADSQQAEPSHAEFPTDCTSCHTINGWIPADFEHTPEFPLTQGHADLPCASCHSAGYENTSGDCIDCHLADFQGADPDHVEGGFPEECTSCHSLSAWTPASFVHTPSFPLIGGHNGVACSDCHSGGYDDTPNECVDCHLADSQSATPSHDGLSTACSTCHQLAGWIPSTFHHTEDFPLTQGHSGVDCASCHSAGYDNTPTECIDCHLADFQGAEPPHDDFPEDCLTCHSLSAWTPASFDHSQTFPLVGGHADVACASCHSAGYENTPTDCVECHLADSQGAEPSHDGFPADCTTCHTIQGWIPADFEHTPSFPLTQGHDNLTCASCHSAGYENTPTDCVDCHLADSQGAEPSHDGLPQDCTTCHSISGWIPSSFSHTQSFPLTQGHSGVDCASCHSAGYDNTPTDCVDCHLADFEGAEPSHDGFPEDCLTCHSLTGWIPADFAHTTTFPLTGGHDNLACADCHSAGYENTPADCIECHLADFMNAEPDHVDGGFPEDCTACHTIQGWTPADFEHPPSFPLTQGHSGLACADCHSAGYENTPTECIECHLMDFQTATPDHDGAGFPQDCTSCHNMATWSPANFNHDSEWFPIYSGEHRNEWDTCADCHLNPNDFGVFSCIDCHEHSRNNTDDEHDDVNGYSYNSNACYNCHPDGRE